MATTSEVRDQAPSTRDRLYGWKAAAPLDHSHVPETPIALPPGPRTPGLLQTVLVWGYRPQYLPRMHEKFGDTFTLNSAPVGRLVVTRDADAIREIFRTSPDIAHAGEGNSLLRPLVGNNSVLTLDAPEHQPARKRLLPPFHGARIARVVSLMEEATAREVATWPVGEDFPLLERTQALTLDIIVRVVMGVDDPARAKRLGDALRGVLNLRITDMLMWVAPGLHRLWPWRNVIRQLDRADELLYEEIERRRNDPDRASRPDVLSMLVDGDADPAVVRDELVTMLAAGHETTAVGLAWTFELVLRHPEVLERLRSGLDDDRDPYRTAVVKEALRVRPVIFNVARRLMEPMQLGGFSLPAGQFVLPSISGLQTDPRIWGSDAAEFRPERWEDSAVPSHAWIPFGGGTRRCLGALFAQTEMETVLRTVLRQVEMRAVGDAEKQRMHHITVVPARGTRVQVTNRLG
jgi:cytochrome P450 family 135